MTHDYSQHQANIISVRVHEQSCQDVPALVSRKLVEWIKCATLEQTLRQTEPHGRVVRPLTSQQVERSSANLPQ